MALDDLQDSGSIGLDVGRVALVALCVLPVVRVPEMLFPYVTPKGLFLQSAAAVAAAVLLWAVGSRVTSLGDGRDPVLWALVSFVALSALSALLGSSPRHSFFGTYTRMWGLGQWLALALFYLGLRTLLRDVDWKVFLRCSLYVALAVAAYGGLDFWLDRMVTATPRIESTLGNPGYFGGYTLLAVGLAFLVADRLGGARRWITLAGAVTLLVGALLLSGNRSALIGLAVGAATAAGVMAVHGARDADVDSRWLFGGVAAAVAGAGLAYVFAPGVVTGIPGVEELAGTTLTSRNLLQRYATWEAALEGFRARPLTGWGPENFSLVYDRFVDPSAYRLGSVRADRAHNVVLGKLTQSGAPGLLAYLAFWGSLVVLTLHGWWTGRLRPLEAAGFLVAFVGYFVFLQAWFEDHSSAALLIAMAAYLRHRYTGGSPLLGFERKKDWSPAHGLVWGGVCVLSLAAVLWMEGRSALAAHRMYQGRAAPRLADRVQRYEQARRLSPPQQREVAARYALAMGNVGSAAGPFLQRSDSLRAVFRRGVGGAEQALNVAAARNPLSGRLDEARGRLAAGAAAVYGGEEIRGAAIESMEAAIEKSPPLLAYRHFLAHLHARFGDRDAAGRTLRETLEVYDGYGRTYYLMAQVSGGEVDEEDLRYLRQAFWLEFRPEDRSDLRRVADALMGGGRPDRAERMLSVYFASHYLPSLRATSDPYREERRQFFGGLDADVASPGTEYRSYEIHPDDMTLLARWPRAAMAAGDCRRATLAMRLLMNGLSEGSATARIRPTLARQLARMQEDCGAGPREPSRAAGESGGA